MSQASFYLKDREPFGKGGNRLCFVHPNDPEKCIKVRRPDFSLEQRRKKKGFPKNLRPLSSFDDNLEEHRTMHALNERFGEVLYEHVSRCYGFESTDMGAGLCSELIRDADGLISITLKQYLWDWGLTDEIDAAIGVLERWLCSYGVPTRDLLLHNLVVQQNADRSVWRIVIIDGVGSSSFLPLALMPKAMCVAKARRKALNLHERVRELLGQRGADEFPGYHGQLFHRGAKHLKDNT